jgi:hypothetical protein
VPRLDVAAAVADIGRRPYEAASPFERPGAALAVAPAEPAAPAAPGRPTGPEGAGR